MTPIQKIKAQIIFDLQKVDPTFIVPEITVENIDDVYEDKLVGEGLSGDLEREFQSSGEKSNISSPASRNYESTSMARQMFDGTWVGWTYWYGGGKHGNPSEIEWMDDAYALDVTSEEERVIVERTFKKAN